MRSAFLLATTILVMAAAMTVSATVASAARVRWQGEFMVTGKFGTCDFDPTGDSGRARFKPGIGGDNGNSSEFSVFYGRHAYSYRLDPGLFNTNFKIVETMGMGDGFGPIDNEVKIRFTSQNPATITPVKDFINIRGQISGYEFMPLCTVNFKMTLFKRIEN